MLGELLRRRFGLDWSHDETFVKKPILFGDYMRMGATGDDRLYEEVSLERLPKLLTAYQVGGWVTAVGPDPPARSASAPLRRLQRAAAVACSAPGGRRPVRRVPQEEFNGSTSKPMTLVFFRECIEHISRLCRVLRQPRGNAMLVGVGGSGKQARRRRARCVRVVAD
jgi:hypothetical protein